MLNGIFLVLIAGSVLTAAFRGTMPRVTEASLTAAKASVDLALGLIGQMALWLGMMAIVREGGLMRSIARALRPLMHGAPLAGGSGAGAGRDPAEVRSASPVRVGRCATSSGVPSATTRPPSRPPPGPSSTSQSAELRRSRS